MLRRLAGTCLGLCALSAPAWGAPGVLILEPRHGVVLSAGAFVVRGVYPAGLQALKGTLLVGRNEYPFVPYGGDWRVEGVSIPSGSTRIKAFILGVGESPPIVVSRPDTVVVGGSAALNVVLKWQPGTDPVLRELAQRTVAGAAGADLSIFTATVRKQSLESVRRVFEAFDIQVTEAVATGPSYEVLLLGADVPGAYGRTIELTCERVGSNGRSEIYLGTLARTFMSDERMWSPASPGDSLDERARQVSNAVARSVAHEILHGVGLVACPWMAPDDGQDRFHNPPNDPLDGGIPWRFGAGNSLMDSGRFVTGASRLLDPATLLSAFDRGYLALLYPKARP